MDEVLIHGVAEAVCYDGNNQQRHECVEILVTNRKEAQSTGACVNGALATVDIDPSWGGKRHSYLC